MFNPSSGLRRRRRALTVTCVLLTFSAASAQVHVLGLPVPRPSQPESRSQLNFVAPRSADVVLAAIEVIDGQILSLQQQLAHSPHYDDAGRVDLFKLRCARVSAVSELEEAGFKGERMEELLELKFDDVRRMQSDLEEQMRFHEHLLQEMTQRYSDDLIGRRAHQAMVGTVIEPLRRLDLHVATEDLAQIAERDLEIARAETGPRILLLAISDKDDETRERWSEWILAHYPEDASERGAIRKARAFDHPIRLQGPDFDGSPIDTNDWIGDVIVVDFWGEWCGPCKFNHPKLASAINANQHRGVRVVGVLCSNDLEVAQAYLESQETAWPQIVAPDLQSPADHPIAREYGVRVWPTLWLIDRSGRLRHEGHHVDEEWLAALDELLNEAVPNESANE